MCMGYPFPIVHVEWSLVFWSFRIIFCRVEKDRFKLNDNNNNVTKYTSACVCVLIKYIYRVLL